MITTPAVLDACRRCGAPTLVGHCGGVLVSASVDPLDERGEVQALFDGRQTYDMHLGGLPRRPHLHLRFSWTISKPRKWKVVADHRCPPGPHFPPPRRPPIDLAISYGKPSPDNPPF